MVQYATQPRYGARVDLASPYAHGLVGRWIFNAGGGRLVPDLSGNGNHLLAFGTPGPLPAAGDAGRASQFDGTVNRYYTVAPGNGRLISGLNTKDRMTLLAWIRRAATGVTTPIFSALGSVTSRIYFGVGAPTGAANQDKLTFGLPSTGGGGIGVPGSATLVANKTYQVAVTKNGPSGNNLTFYLDGNVDLVTAIAGAATDTTGKLVGTDPRAPTYFNGLIYQIAIYDRVLAPGDIRALYLAPYADLAPPLALRLATMAAGGTNYPQSLGGTLAGSGGPTRATSKTLAGVV